MPAKHCLGLSKNFIGLPLYAFEPLLEDLKLGPFILLRCLDVIRITFDVFHGIQRLLRFNIDTIRCNLHFFWPCHLICSCLCVGQLLAKICIQVAKLLIQRDQRLCCVCQFLPELQVHIHHMLFEIFRCLDLVSKLHTKFHAVSA